MRRMFLAAVAVLALTAGRAEAVTIRDLIELTKAGLSDPVLFALIEADHPLFTVDAATIKQLKEGGVSEGVILAVIKSGRTAPAQPAQDPQPQPKREPEVIVIDHHDTPQAPAAPVGYPSPMAYPIPVAVPVYVPYPSASRRITAHDTNTIRATINTDQGLVNATVPVPRNCVKAEPVYWGFGGQLRPGSYPPPPMMVCR